VTYSSLCLFVLNGCSKSATGELSGWALDCVDFVDAATVVCQPPTGVDRSRNEFNFRDSDTRWLDIVGCAVCIRWGMEM